MEIGAEILARSKSPPPIAAEIFLATAWPLLREGSENEPALWRIPDPGNVIQALARPESAVSIIYQRFYNFGIALINRPLFGNNVLTAAEYEAVLELTTFVFTVMDAEWNWRPRDLWDVQGFVWATCKDKLGDK